MLSLDSPDFCELEFLSHLWWSEDTDFATFEVKICNHHIVIQSPSIFYLFSLLLTYFSGRYWIFWLSQFVRALWTVCVLVEKDKITEKLMRSKIRIILCLRLSFNLSTLWTSRVWISWIRWQNYIESWLCSWDSFQELTIVTSKSQPTGK